MVGCALAWVLGRRFRRIIVLKKESAPGLHASGRNSGVVHSGFNPKPGTLKARLCIEGNRRLAEYAQANGVPFRRVGTFVIARSESEAKVIEILRRNGVANGVPGIEIISGDALRKHEPNALGDAALYAPTGAIIDSISFVQSLAESAKKQGAEFLFGCQVNGIREMADHVEISTDTKRISAAFVVNCAGVYADKIAHAMGIGRKNDPLTVEPISKSFIDEGTASAYRLRHE